MINQEIDQELDPEIGTEEEKDSTNWKGWYLGLMAFLVVQIFVYLWITNSYGS